MRYLIQNEVIKDLEIAEDFKLIDLDDVKKNMYYISEDGKIYSTFLNDFLNPKHDKKRIFRIMAKHRTIEAKKIMESPSISCKSIFR